jgi:hypothetical protein
LVMPSTPPTPATAFSAAARSALLLTVPVR